MQRVEADYQDGVLRPSEPLSLRPGERVNLIIVRQPDPRRWDLARLAAAASADEAALTEAGLSEWCESLDSGELR